MGFPLAVSSIEKKKSYSNTKVKAVRLLWKTHDQIKSVQMISSEIKQICQHYQTLVYWRNNLVLTIKTTITITAIPMWFIQNLQPNT